MTEVADLLWAPNVEFRDARLPVAQSLPEAVGLRDHNRHVGQLDLALDLLRLGVHEQVDALSHPLFHLQHLAVDLPPIERALERRCGQDSDAINRLAPAGVPNRGGDRTPVFCESLHPENECIPSVTTSAISHRPVGVPTRGLAVRVRQYGGDAQNRTGDGGFADLCLATWLRRRLAVDSTFEGGAGLSRGRLWSTCHSTTFGTSWRACRRALS